MDKRADTVVDKTIDFRYVPLSFISNHNGVERQSLNTVLFKHVSEVFRKISPLGKLLDFTQYGYTASAKDKGNCRLLRITDINNGKVNWNNIPYSDCKAIKKYELSSKDVLIARTGNNISYLVDENVPNDTVFASYLIRLICNKEKLLSEYLYLFLNSYAFWPQILTKQQGSLLQNVNAERMKELLIPYCPLEEQKKLVDNSNEQVIQAQKKIKYLLNCHQQLTTELSHQQTLLKKLRQQILQEAIEGKLTAEWRQQNPDVEPASELLACIQAEKEQLIKDKKIKKQKSLPPISDEEKPFDLPDGWVWCRLIELSEVNTGATPLTSEPSYYGGSINWMTSGDTGNDYVLTTKNRITEKALNQTNCKIFPIETLVVAMYGQGKTRGQITELKIEAATNQACAAIQLYLFSPITNQFIKIHFKKIYDEIRELAQGGAQPNLNMRKIKSTIIAFPPLPEQKAIVTKVKKLLALCDQTQTQITASKIHAKQLMQAVLKEAFSQQMGNKISALPIIPVLENKYFVKRKMLASYIINQSLEDENFGDTKFEKMLYLSDCHILKRNLGQKYLQKAAGPYDNKFTYAFFKQVQTSKWFKKQKIGAINRIVAGKNIEKSKNTYNYFSDEELEHVDDMLQLFKKSNYQKPEIVATLYAVWNNRIINQQKVTDELLKSDFLAWDKQKNKYKDRIFATLDWMREKNIIPGGWGDIVAKPSK